MQSRAGASFLGIALILGTALPVPAQSRKEEVAFDLRHGYLIVVKGSTGNLGDLSFVVDTGTTHSMLDRKVAERLSLRYHSRSILNIDRYQMMQWADLDELQAGPIRAKHVRVMVGDLKKFSEYADNLDGIIGVDLLRTSRSMSINYVTRSLAFEFEAEGNTAKGTDAQALVMRVPVQGQPVKLILDTGMEGMLLYADRIGKKLPHLKLTNRRGHAHEGRLTGERATLDGIQLGSPTVQSPVFLVRRAPSVLSSDIDGYMGIGVLHAKWVEVDFLADTIRWQ